MLSAATLAFLRAPRHAVIATHDRDGDIHQAVVWYAVTGDRIVMNALGGRRWPENLRRDPRLTMTVFDGEEYVILKGIATVIDDPDRGQADAIMLARRYGGDPEAHLAQVRVSIEFNPMQVALHGQLAAPSG